MNLNKLTKIEIDEAKRKLTSNKGIYFWFSNISNDIVYIGIAVGVGGLRRRIALQHLNSNYLEYRIEKQSSKDFFQLQHRVEKFSSKDNTIRYGIDKSAFRKSIGRSLELKPGKETVDYIFNNLHLKIFESEDIAKIKMMEKELIKEYQPVFNTTFK